MSNTEQMDQLSLRYNVIELSRCEYYYNKHCQQLVGDKVCTYVDVQFR